MKRDKGIPVAKPAAVSIELLIDGAQKACSNAEALFGEARLLADHGATARALCLHQISLEECSKVEFLGAWAMSLVGGHDPDPRRTAKAFSSHAAKNRLNAYMLEPSEAELLAREAGDWAAASAEFKKSQEAFHRFSNNNKNAALYVDWTGSAFVAPAEAITAELVEEIAALNARFLEHARLQLRMFDRLQAEGGVLKPELAKLIETLEAMGTESVEERIAGADEAIAAFLKAAIGNRTAK